MKETANGLHSQMHRLNYQLSGKNERRTHTIYVILHNLGDYVKLFPPPGPLHCGYAALFAEKLCFSDWRFRISRLCRPFAGSEAGRSGGIAANQTNSSTVK